ncbi:MAG: FAD-dependent monooxygenase [Pseudomonadota bacterium]
MSETYDILIAGGGVAGLTAAAAFGTEGRRVLCVDRAPADAGTRDTRTTAFLMPAIDLLKDAGVWPLLDGETEALDIMRLIDAGGKMNEAREIGDFAAREITDSPFGWNVPNAAMRMALTTRIGQLSNVTLMHETAVDALTLRRDTAIAHLSSGTTARARLVIGADGRDSAVRDLAGIDARRWSYGQKGLVFTVTHEESHRNVSTEIHRTGGPFTLVPMPDRDGMHRSSVVWMEQAGEADRLAALPDDAFSDVLNERSLGVLGALTPASPRAAWPIISLIAGRLTGPRVALIAEAAHVVPPIGAQGLNMSLGDIAALMTATAGEDPGHPAGLTQYQKRWRELAARVAGVDALNRAAQAEWQPLRDLRRLGLGTLIRLRPAKHMAMRLGLGVR